ncbi:hypothetical protein NST58_20465 [Paenibacillus sp. FSL R10-2796]|uniref:hypothetical protein n=1 Tax=Paenibacillus TaxID=44249 RepID=UPI00096C62DD|nr:hypothetical protein [Paenibacillus odorifer]OMD95047.1 hypothetical protein BSK64_29720 [Paenibacillus odorifer]
MSNIISSEDEFTSEMIDITDKYEIQYEKFISETSAENYFQIILRAHLYIEHELQSMVNGNIKYPELLGNRLTFSDKMRLVFAIGLWPIEDMDLISKINKLRNKFAHNREFQLSVDDVNSLISSLSTRQLRQYKILNKDNEDLSTTLRNILFTVWSDLISYNIIPKHIKDYVGIKDFE